MRLVLAILYGLAMVLLPLAHRMSALQSGPPAELVAFALPDGSLPVLCQPGKSGTGSKLEGSSCPACLLLSSPGLPGPIARHAAPMIRCIGMRGVACPEEVAPLAAVLSAHPRAPPLA